MKKYLSRFTTASICTCVCVLHGVWRHVTMILPVLIFICGTNQCSAGVTVPALSSEGCWGAGMTIIGDSCYPTNTGGGGHINKGQYFSDILTSCISCTAEYPPAGTYVIEAWTCPGDTGSVGLCDVSTATLLSKGNTIDFDGHTSVWNLGLHAGWADNTRTTSGGFYCFTMMNVGDGTYYKTQEGAPWCTGTDPLPVTPSGCSFSTAAMNVIFGELKRADIQTSAEGGANSRTESASVACSGSDDVLNVTTRFIYTTKLIGDAKAVSVTGNKDLGVAITYKGKVVSPDESYTDTLSSGSNSIDLGFEVIRDPNVALREIKTGEFSANAVMQMTIQ